MSNGEFRFLHVTFHSMVTTPKIYNSLKETFNAAEDWLHYHSDCWILWTSEDAETWYARIDATPGLPNNYGVLIAPIDLDRQHRSGKMLDWEWKWINKNR